ncbi:MAG: N-acetylmuramoyl-L-alanine amidase [Candidatus Deianiraeaceae bacterium]|jgi:N-acetylmuramoyl-L-alanine amidase
MPWLLSIVAIFVFHNVRALDVPSKLYGQVDLETILERIAEIDASSKINNLIDKIMIKDNYYVQKRRGKVIIIDAGHGGKDPGTTGGMKTVEKHITLQYSLLLGKILRDAGYTVFLTRNSDNYLTLVDRRKFAQNYNGSLMISIHADSATNISARGLSAYTLSDESTDNVAKMLAESNNKSNDITFKSSVKDDIAKMTLINVAQNATISKSEYFVKILLNYAQNDKLFIIPNPHRKAGFAVLKMPDVPSVLLELGFLSNPEEEILLKSPVYRNQIIHTMFKSIDKFFRVEGDE